MDADEVYGLIVFYLKLIFIKFNLIFLYKILFLRYQHFCILLLLLRFLKLLKLLNLKLKIENFTSFTSFTSLTRLIINSFVKIFKNFNYFILSF